MNKHFLQNILAFFATSCLLTACAQTPQKQSIPVMPKHSTHILQSNASLNIPVEPKQQNVWNVDAVYESPLTEYEKLMQPVKSLFGGESKFDMNGVKRNFNEVKGYNGTPYSEAAYGEITASLGEAKDSPNGYFILIALSIGTILLQQFITMRSQKAQNKYSSVDGQQAMTQKTTMIVMTLMFGIFAFMYSSAFSIYMITSSIFSLLSTMLINKLVDVSMNKKEAQAMQEKYTRTLPGRKQPEPKNKKKK